MDAFALYLLLCGLTIASPGPGVLLTVNKALLLQLRGALPGILGVVLGILLVAILASTALGVLVSSSPRALQGLQLLGAFYLGWLGLSRLRQGSPPGEWTGKTRPLLVSLINPKLIIFFLALFPPFIQADRPVLPQLVLLVATFCLLSLLIDCSYAGAAAALSAHLTSSTALARLVRAAGGLFLLFAVLLLGAALGCPRA